MCDGGAGRLLDTIARMPLWQAGLDYRHGAGSTRAGVAECAGTGHGVGHCLNVHEGPHGIGQRPAQMQHPLQLGAIVTNGAQRSSD